MKKEKLNKYAIVFFDAEDGVCDNWLLVRYNSLKNRKYFKDYSDRDQFVFDKDAKVIHRSDHNKKTVSVSKPKNKRTSVHFKDETVDTRFYLYLDEDDGDVKFKMESDEQAILYAISLRL